MTYSSQDLRVRLPLCLSVVLASTSGVVRADESTQGFVEDSKLEVLSRNFYLNSDYRSPSPAGKSYKAEWAQGFIASFESGFTPGTLGFGLDAHGFLGMKLDGGKGHSGTGYCRWTVTATAKTTTPVVAAP
jgi:hypothetical protein